MSYLFPFTVCCEVSSPEDKAVNRRVLTGYAPASSFLELDDNENVREYILEAQGKQRIKPTLVHQKIRNTLLNETDKFSILNSGITLVSRSARYGREVDVLHLEQASIINGSQTRGELRRYVEAARHSGEPLVVPSVFFQLIVTDDEDLVAEISIARNFQNDVKPISIVGRLGHLDQLQASLMMVNPLWKLRMSETDLASGGYVDTEKLIQIVFALMPEELAADYVDNKANAYSQKTRCLKMFQTIFENRKTDEHREAYKYFIDIAPTAWGLYIEWKSHDAFKSSGIHSIERDGTTIVEIPDGIVFPIIASLSVFVRKGTRDGTSVYKLTIPSRLEARDLVAAAKQVYQEIARRSPQAMGKSKACYSSLLRVTSIYARLS